MEKLFNNQQDFTEAATKIFGQHNLLDKHIIVTNWSDKDVFGDYAIGLQPISQASNEDPDNIFFQENNVFAYVYTYCSPETWYEPQSCDYVELDKTFNTLEEAIEDYLKWEKF